MLEGRLLNAARDQVAFLRYWRQAGRTRRAGGRPRLQNVEPSRYDRRAQLVTWFSPTLGVTKRLHIYLPPGYDESHQRYPVLYLLRGHEREWLNVDEDTSRHGHNVLDVYERLLYGGEIGPLILVVPSLTSDDGTVHGLGIDLLKPWLGRQAAGTGTGRWESYLLHDVIPFVDAHWRTLRSGAYRGIDGFSLGGAVAAKLGAKFPTFFRTVGAYDGTFLLPTDDGSAVLASDTILRNPLFEPAFGRRRNIAYATANSPINLLLRTEYGALAQITWMIQYGPRHIEPFGSNFFRGERLVAALQRRGIANGLDEAVLGDGNHCWRTADRHMAMTLPLHWRALRGAA